MKPISKSAEWIFLAINLGLEMLSAACDLASSSRRPHYVLFGMLLAIAAVLIFIGELIYRGKKEEVVLGKWGMIWWFYHPPPPPDRHTPFGTLLDIYGLVAGISQCICSMVQYVYFLRHADNPFKVSLLPAIFLICLGASKLINNPMNANTTDNIIGYREVLDLESLESLDLVRSRVLQLDLVWSRVLRLEHMQQLRYLNLSQLLPQQLQQLSQLLQLPQLSQLPQLMLSQLQQLILLRLQQQLPQLQQLKLSLLHMKQVKQLRPKED